MIAFHRLIIVVLLLVTAATANAQNFWPSPRADQALIAQRSEGLTAQQLKILRAVGDSYRPVTEDLHREFWSLFTEENRRVWIAAEKAELPKADLVLLKEVLDVPYWHSMYLSLREGQVIKAPDLEASRAKALSLMQSATDKAKLNDIFQSQDRWLDPQLSDHSRMIWYGDLLRVFEQWNTARARLEQAHVLLSSVWSPEPRAWPYLPLHLNLTWTYPWSMNPAMFCGSPCKAWSLLHGVDDESGGGLYYFGGQASPDRLLNDRDTQAGMNLMTDLISTYKVIYQSREEEIWQGYRSTIYRSSIDDGVHKRNYRIVRILFREQYEDVLLVISASSRSMAHAEQVIGRIEEAIELN